MSKRQAADLSKIKPKPPITARKGEADSATPYIGDDVQTGALQKSVQAKVQTQGQGALPAHLQIAKPEARTDALNIRITASERARIAAAQERLGGASITQTLMLALGSLERELSQ